MNYSTFEKKYINLLKEILLNGIEHEDRTGVGRISSFGLDLKINLQEGFPLLATKYVHFKSIAVELLWFLNCHIKTKPYCELEPTNIKFLVDNGVNIWNDWPFQDYINSGGNMSMSEFKESIKSDLAFAKQYGNLGPVYGSQWNDWDGINQLSNVIEEIKKNPYSTRHLVNAWNPAQLGLMKLPPCHYSFQFVLSPSLSGNNIDLIFNMRSTDVFLGLPFNIASYALLLNLIALEVNATPRFLKFSGADVHIYNNHVDAIQQQIRNFNMKKGYDLPQLLIDKQKNIQDYKFEHFKINGYNHHGKIKAPVAV